MSLVEKLKIFLFPTDPEQGIRNRDFFIKECREQIIRKGIYAAKDFDRVYKNSHDIAKKHEFPNQNAISTVLQASNTSSLMENVPNAKNFHNHIEKMDCNNPLHPDFPLHKLIQFMQTIRLYDLNKDVFMSLCESEENFCKTGMIEILRKVNVNVEEIIAQKIQSSKSTAVARESSPSIDK